MAHELHAADRMASFGGIRPWHADQTTLDGRCIVHPSNPATWDEALQISAQNWTAEQIEIRAGDTGALFSDFIGWRRSDTHQHLTVTSKWYNQVSPREIVAPLAVLIGAANGGGKIETVGTVKNSKLFFASVSLGITHDIVPGDAVRTFVMVSNPYGSIRQSLRVTRTKVRPVCMNTIIAGESEGSRLFTVSHDTTIHQQMEDGERILASIVQKSDEDAEEMRTLARRQMRDDEVMEVLGLVFPLPKDASERRIKTNQELLQEVLELSECGMGTEIPGVRGTAWGLLNAITEQYDHKRRSDQMWDVMTARGQFGSVAEQKVQAYETVKRWVASN